jgi:CheY-like chemotaxis protein
MMPDMDGMEAVRQIRYLGYTKPIVALTANAVAGQTGVFQRSGFDGFISKPVDIRQLNAVLNKYVRDIQPPEVLEAARREKNESQAPENADIRQDDPPSPETVAEVDGGSADQPGNQAIQKDIDGLEIGKALKKYNGDQVVYFNILRTYVANVRSLLGEIETVSAATLPDYKIKIHGIKGASLDVHAEKLGSMAGKLEFAADNGDIAYIEYHNPEFLVYARALISNVEEMLEAASNDGAKPKMGAPDHDLLLKLLAACNEYNIAVVDDVMAEIEKFQYESDGELVAWLRKRVDLMNYSHIVEKLSGLD